MTGGSLGETEGAPERLEGEGPNDELEGKAELLSTFSLSFEVF